ncbi:hypothetical protein [Achromobacter xylosoxidans]|uniref:hypothetical protein n=1 Tax=Alcaligenes xylosoxydans xylosoxydans TaxID=85698 RepID=UPI001C528E66|nr:hypothetical protein [Achromobacter xylosoxidans]
MQEQIALVMKDIPEDGGAVLPWLFAQADRRVIRVFYAIQSVATQCGVVLQSRTAKYGSGRIHPKQRLVMAA